MGLSSVWVVTLAGLMKQQRQRRSRCRKRTGFLGLWLAPAPRYLFRKSRYANLYWTVRIEAFIPKRSIGDRPSQRG